MSLKTRFRNTLIDITGYWIYKHSDLPVGTDLVSDLKQKLRIPLNTIFDVGANVGQTAIRFNEQFPQASIFSFEPVAATFNTLTSNVSPFKNIRCFPMALGEKKETVPIKLFPDSASVLNSLNEKAMNNAEGFRTEKIQVTSGDTFCASNNIPEIDLLKIDTEGFELQVLAGFSKMIAASKIKAIYCETGFSPSNSRNTFLNDLLLFAGQNGFQFYGLYDVVHSNIAIGNHFGNVLLVNKDIL